MIRAALRALAVLADRLLAPPDWTWEFASWSTPDSRQRTPGTPASPATPAGGAGHQPHP